MYGKGGGLGNIPKQGLGAAGGCGEAEMGGLLKAQDPGARADLQATHCLVWSRDGGRAFPPL